MWRGQLIIVILFILTMIFQININKGENKKEWIYNCFTYQSIFMQFNYYLMIHQEFLVLNS